MSTINERIWEIRNQLCDGNNQLFANRMGVTKQVASSYVRNGYSIGKKVQENLLSVFPNLSKVWLLTGEGSMLKSEKKEDGDIITKAGIRFRETASGKYIMRVPLVPIHAYAKYIDETRDAIEWEGEDFVEFYSDQVYHGSYMAFEIKGDSMDDDSKRSLSHGDIVNARELSFDKWRFKLHTDKYPNWIIVTDNTILCKQIVDQNMETGEITCHSLNASPEYADFTLNLNEVRRLFNIVQKTTTSF